MSFLQTLAMDATSLSPATMIVALGLLAPALIAAYQFFQKPSFYSASTTFALLLVFVGYASTVFVGLQTSNHHAYLVAFSTSSLGACSLIIVTALNLHRLLKHLQSSSGQYLRLFWASPQTALNCIAVLQTMALAFFGLSVVYASNLHSSSPIVGAGGALARVYAELRAIAAAKYAHISQSTTLVGILLVSLATWRYAPGPVERTQPSAEGWKRTALNNAPIVTAYATTVLLVSTSRVPNVCQHTNQLHRCAAYY